MKTIVLSSIFALSLVGCSQPTQEVDCNKLLAKMKTQTLDEILKDQDPLIKQDIINKCIIRKTHFEKSDPVVWTLK